MVKPPAGGQGTLVVSPASRSPTDATLAQLQIRLAQAVSQAALLDKPTVAPAKFLKWQLASHHPVQIVSKSLPDVSATLACDLAPLGPCGCQLMVLLPQFLAATRLPGRSG